VRRDRGGCGDGGRRRRRGGCSGRWRGRGGYGDGGRWREGMGGSQRRRLGAGPQGAEASVGDGRGVAGVNALGERCRRLDLDVGAVAEEHALELLGRGDVHLEDDAAVVAVGKAGGGMPAALADLVGDLGREPQHDVLGVGPRPQAKRAGDLVADLGAPREGVAGALCVHDAVDGEVAHGVAGAAPGEQVEGLVGGVPGHDGGLDDALALDAAGPAIADAQGRSGPDRVANGVDDDLVRSVIDGGRGAGLEPGLVAEREAGLPARGGQLGPQAGEGAAEHGGMESGREAARDVEGHPLVGGGVDGRRRQPVIRDADESVLGVLDGDAGVAQGIEIAIHGADVPAVARGERADMNSALAAGHGQEERDAACELEVARGVARHGITLDAGTDVGIATLTKPPRQFPLRNPEKGETITALLDVEP